MSAPPTRADVVYARDGERPLALDVYAARGPAAVLYDGTVFVHLHGGGWRRGDKAHVGVAGGLAARGLTTVSANYTLTGDRPYPQNLDDVLTLVRFVATHPDELGVRADRIILGGASAGGHLSALAAVKGTAEGTLTPEVAGIVSWYAPLSPESRYLTHRYPPVQRPGGFWDRGLERGARGDDPFRSFIGTDDFASVTLREAWDADPRFHLDRVAASDLPPFLLLSGTDDSVEIQASQKQLFAALDWVGADVQLLTVEGADHESARYRSSAAAGAVLGFVADIIHPPVL